MLRVFVVQSENDIFPDIDINFQSSSSIYFLCINEKQTRNFSKSVGAIDQPQQAAKIDGEGSS
jgi:hypothetical protein